MPEIEEWVNLPEIMAILLNPGENALIRRSLKYVDKKTNLNLFELSSLIARIKNGMVVVQTYTYPSSVFRLGLSPNIFELEITDTASLNFPVEDLTLEIEMKKPDQNFVASFGMRDIVREASIITMTNEPTPGVHVSEATMVTGYIFTHWSASSEAWLASYETILASAV